MKSLCFLKQIFDFRSSTPPVLRAGTVQLSFCQGQTGNGCGPATYGTKLSRWQLNNRSRGTELLELVICRETT